MTHPGPGTKVLALDIGTKRVGLALSDEDRIIAQPLSVMPWKGTEALVETLRRMIVEWNVGTLVLGLPLHMSGREDHRTRSIRELAARLASVLGIDVVLWDERLTSREAERILVDAGMRRKRRKENVDKLAASIILKAYLESRRAGQGPWTGN